MLLLFAGIADSQEPAPVPTPARTHLVVGLTQSPPFCIRDEDGSWSGISVELWQWIAADLGIDTEFRETTVTGLFDDLAPGRPLDVSIGALTITARARGSVGLQPAIFSLRTRRGGENCARRGRIVVVARAVLAWNFWRIVAATACLAGAGGAAHLGAGA